MCPDAVPYAIKENNMRMLHQFIMHIAGHINSSNSGKTIRQSAAKKDVRKREQTHHSTHTVRSCRTNRMVIWVCCCIDSAITIEDKKGNVYYDNVKEDIKTCSSFTTMFIKCNCITSGNCAAQFTQRNRGIMSVVCICQKRTM